MKNFYLYKNETTNEYYLEASPIFGKERVYLESREEKEVFNEIKKYLDPKRKTVFKVDEKVPKELTDRLREFVKDTKINLERIGSNESH